MKKQYIFGLFAASLLGLTACNPDADPKMDTTKDFTFVLNVPPMANQFLDLSTGGNVTLTVSQPDYGLTLAPTYGIQVSLKQDFTPVTTDVVITSDGEEHIVPGYVSVTLESQIAAVLEVKTSNLAKAINQLNGIYEEDQYEEDYEGPLYVRATASVGAGLSVERTYVESNVITLAQVKGFADFTTNEVCLGVPGGANGWDTEIPLLVAYDTDMYHGFARLDGGFKITVNGWATPGNYGANDTGIVDNGDGTYSGTLVENGGDFNAPAGGLYWIDVVVTNPATAEGQIAGTFTLTPIESVGICGDFNGWDTSTAIEMTNDGDYVNWTANGTVTSGGWKFIFNGGWDVNLGTDDSGSIENLQLNGGNISLDGTTVKLNISRYPWTATVQ